jgi:FdhD protein
VTLPPELTEGHPLFGVGYAPPHRARPVERLEEGTRTPGSVEVAEEVPVAFVYNEHPHVVMMATPADLEDFAVGFSLSEEIVARASDIGAVRAAPYSQGVELAITIPAAAADALRRRGRQLVGQTGCGLCGVQTVQEALRPPRVVTAQWTLAPESLWRAEAGLAMRQSLNLATGAVHAAAWATPDGEIRVLREDVGRHNALDKVLGALARAGTDPSTGFCVMTSRASYELVQKAAAVGIPILAAVSRPTGLAVRMAEACGMTLVALLRGRSCNVYAGGGRLR